ncbi:MAG TPA: aspartate carbamoyltransferase catalytic subunit [Candidatus Spyradocola merdavium]|nr:aspartate carbamoyltransferase catalytic subunit [Candidatus Spyradocola merdavium]
MAFKHKDLLSLRDVEREEIEMILSTAASMRQLLDSPTKKTAHLQGKSIVTLFYENSTRTRMSFELASKYMSAAAANISASASSVQKGETLLDTGRTLDRMGTDVIIIRHPMSGAPHLLAQHVNAAVINAGDGINEHPTQALLDMFTIKRHKGRLDGLKVAIVGDVLHSRVARSNIFGLHTMGAEVALCAPPTLMPAQMEELGVKTYTRVEEAVEGADVVMGLRIQKERQEEGNFPSLREYSEFFGINEERMKYAKPDALIMHPGPINRGVEITSDAADCEQSVINEQVTSGVAVRMALLYLLTRKGVQSV